MNSEQSLTIPEESNVSCNAAPTVKPVLLSGGSSGFQTADLFLLIGCAVMREIGGNIVEIRKFKREIFCDWL